jgi:hypothetical protein
MGESYIKAFAVDRKRLEAVVGCKDEALLERLLADDMVEEVDEILEENECTVEEVLREIMFEDLEVENAYLYRRVLEVVAGAVGKPLVGDVTLPGRGWQDIAPIWEEWGQPTLSRVWGLEKPYPWPLRRMSVDWPLAFHVDATTSAKMKKELAQFRPGPFIPEGVPRFSDGRWDRHDLATIMEEVAKLVGSWCEGEILVWHDGQQ